MSQKGSIELYYNPLNIDGYQLGYDCGGQCI